MAISLALAVRCAATFAAFVAGASGPRLEWLVGAVGRGARRRLLAAVDEPAPGRAIARERLRGEQALASLRRLGAAPAAIGAAREALAAFAARELPGGTTDQAPPNAPPPNC